MARTGAGHVILHLRVPDISLRTIWYATPRHKGAGARLYNRMIHVHCLPMYESRAVNAFDSTPALALQPEAATYVGHMRHQAGWFGGKNVRARDAKNFSLNVSLTHSPMFCVVVYVTPVSFITWGQASIKSVELTIE